MANEGWQKDWHVFADLLQEYLITGKSEEELSTYFGGKPVRWHGQLEEKNIEDDILPAVAVGLPPREMSFNGSHARIGALSLSIAGDAKQAWRNAEVGSNIEFTARLRSKDSLFPPVYVSVLDSKALVVLIGLSEGRLVE